MEAINNYVAVIKVVGIGGGGCNAVNRMIECDLGGVEFISINTDAQALMINDSDIKLSIGHELTSGLGAGANPEVGEKAAEADRDEIKKHLEGADMVFITVGEGGGTGTGAAPVVAEIARDMDALTVAIVTRPFGFEGRRRQIQAEEGIKKLRDKVDAQIVIPNDRLMTNTVGDVLASEAFGMANDILLNGVRGITDLITKPGVINTDFADVQTILTNAGSALMGIGQASGEERGAGAARKAISSPLLEDSMDSAKGILFNIAAGHSLTMQEIQDAADTITSVAHPDAEIIFGTTEDDNLGDHLKVTVIAAGFNRRNSISRTSAGGSESESSKAMEDVLSDLDRDTSFLSGGDDDDFEVPSFLR